MTSKILGLKEQMPDVLLCSTLNGSEKVKVLVSILGNTPDIDQAVKKQLHKRDSE